MLPKTEDQGESTNRPEVQSMWHQQDPKRDLREVIERIFSDNFMIVLTFLMIPIIILPIFIVLSGDMLEFLEACDVIIVGLFMVEYSAKLYLAKNRWTHFKIGWHILDLIIIVLSLIGYMPFFAFGISGSPTILLRLLRLPRALAIGGRTVGTRLRNLEPEINEHPQEIETIIRKMDDREGATKDHITWEEMSSDFKTSIQIWIDIYNISEKHYRKLSEIFQIPEEQFQNKLISEGFPRIDFLENASLVVIQFGEIKYPDANRAYLTIQKTSFLIICTGNDIVTISQEKTDIFEKISPEARKNLKEKPLALFVLYNVLEYALRKYKAVVNAIELELTRMENIPMAKVPRDFLERNYQLKKELSGLALTLLHLRETIGNVASNKVPLEGYTPAWAELLELRKDEAAFLQESADNAKENLLSIIDLYINRTSHETNKVMKVLAVITALAVIPAMVSGLLGENLIDVPFGVFLWQVIMIVALAMVLGIYIFIKLGWLKF